MLATTLVVIILQYINVLNQHVVYTLNLHNVKYQLYLNKNFFNMKKEKRKT